MKNILFIVLCSCCNFLFAQVNFTWAIPFGGADQERGFDVATDASLNVYSVGDFGGTTDFDPGPSTFFLTAGVTTDGYVSKLGANSSFIWAKHLPGCFPKAVTVDLSGNVYVTGFFASVIADFDPGPGTFTMAPSAGKIFVLKLTNAGNFVWAKQMGGTGTNLSLGIRVDASGNVYTTGHFTGTVDMDPGPSVVPFTSLGVDDIFISKLNSSGNYVWAKQIGGSSYDYAYSLALDPSANLYISGSFRTGVLDVDPGAGVYTVTPSGVNNDAYLLKLDQGGNFIWFKQFGGASFDSYANDVAIDAIGDVCVTGKYSGTSDFNPGAGVFNLVSAGLSDIFVVKLNSVGNFIWAKSMGGTGADEGISIGLGSDGDVYTTGTFSLTSDFDPGVSAFPLTAVGNTDIFASKFDSTGLFVWAGAMGGAQMDRPQSIAIDQSQSLLIKGYFGSTLADFNPGIASYTLAAQFTSDAFLLKLCQPPDPPMAINGNTLVCSGASNNYTVSTATGATAYTWNWPVGWSGTPSFTSASIIAGNTNGNISVTALNTCGASSAVSLSITVNISPTVSVNSGSICAGQSFTISPSGANTYTISGNNFTVSPLTTNAYSVTGTSTAGCITLSASVANLTVSSLPTIAVNSGSICTGQIFTIVPTGALTYTVSGNNFTVNPVINTSYSVTGTSSAGCVSSNTVVSNVTVNITPTISVNSGSICLGQSFTIVPFGASSYTYSGGSPFVSPINTGSYSVVGSSLGCVSGSVVSTVTVFSVPITANSSTNAICIGNSITLNGSGATGYVWTGGVVNNVPFSPSSTTVYTVSGSAPNGCVGNATIQIVVFSLPSLTLVTANNLLCLGQTTTLTASGANNYTWNPGGNGASIVVSPTLNITYTVTGTDANGCSNTNTLTQNVSPCTGIEIVEQALELNAYPNPTTGKFILTYKMSWMPFEIYNTHGHKITVPTVINNLNVEIDLSKETAGIYFIKVGTGIKKIIKE